MTNKVLSGTSSIAMVIIGALVCAACSSEFDSNQPGASESQGAFEDGKTANVAADRDERIDDKAPRSELYSAPADFGAVNCDRIVASPNVTRESVIGIHIGDSLDRALNVLRCHGGKVGHYAYLDSSMDFTNADGLLEKQGVSYTRGRRIDACKNLALKGSNPKMWSIQCTLGGTSDIEVTETVTLFAPGVPGQQRVMSIKREQFFGDKDQPAIQAVGTALIEKYGPPTWSGGDGSYLKWVGPNAKGIVSLSCTEFNRISSACGTAIAATIPPANPSGDVLARSVAVEILDHELALRIGQETQSWVDARHNDRLNKAIQDAKPVESLQF